MFKNTVESQEVRNLLISMTGLLITTGSLNAEPSYFVWDKVYAKGIGFSIAPVSDGGAAVAGWRESKSRGDDALVVRLDRNGAVLWDKTFGGPRNDRAMSVISLPNGDYMRI